MALASTPPSSATVAKPARKLCVVTVGNVLFWKAVFKFSLKVDLPTALVLFQQAGKIGASGSMSR